MFRMGRLPRGGPSANGTRLYAYTKAVSRRIEVFYMRWLGTNACSMLFAVPNKFACLYVSLSDCPLGPS